MQPVHIEAQSIHEVLERAAELDPTAVAVTFLGDRSFTRSELLAEVRSVATGMREAGLGTEDRIALMITNRSEFLVAWLAVSYIGAVSVPLNTALRGDVLTYMLDSVSPCVLLTETGLAASVMPAVAHSGGVTTVWSVPDSAGRIPPGTRPFDELLSGAPAAPAHRPASHDLASILFTSGTTGRSKGVMWSHRTAIAFCESSIWVMGYSPDDVVYTCLPLFHINALFMGFLAVISAGASTVVSSRFSARRYWEEITESGATVTNMLGAMGAVLWKQPPSPAEQAHRLRLVMVVPFPVDHHAEFEDRFAVRICELYGSTDTAIPIGTPHGEHRPGSCGTVTPSWEVCLVDPEDRPVPPGTPGELVTRPREPFVGQLGYWRQPEETWKAHRNAWFHTGDVLIEDEDGWFRFQDRIKDALRVSGENVSSFEVEQVLVSHPSVAEAAVFAVPSELGEDSVMACIVTEPGQSIEPQELIEFVAPRLAYFAVPRYVEVVDQLPKTTTQKVQKAVLRTRGITGETWDSGPRRRSTGS